MNPELLTESVMIGIVVTSIALVISNLLYHYMKKVGG